MKEDSLSPKFDYTIYRESIKGVEDLYSLIETRYLDKTSEERLKELESGEKIQEGVLSIP